MQMQSTDDHISGERPYKVVAVALAFFSCAALLASCDGVEGGEDKDIHVTWARDGVHGVLSVAAASADVTAAQVFAFDSSVPDDLSIGATIWAEGGVGCCAELHPNGRLKDIRVRIPLWHPFTNRLRIEVVTAADVEAGPYVEELQIEVEPDDFVDAGLDRTVGPSELDGEELDWDFRPVGGMTVTVPSAVTMTSCRASAVAHWCQDGDDDGLVDSFEMLLVEVARPVLVFRPDDRVRRTEIVTDDGRPVAVPVYDELALFSTMIPFEDAGTGDTGYAESGQRFVFQPFVVAYEWDHGPAGVIENIVGGHPGDTEQVKLMWELTSETPESTELRLHSVFTAGHNSEDLTGEYIDPFSPRIEITTDPRDVYVDGNDRLVVFVELDKHGTWTRPDDCEEISPYPCVEAGGEFFTVAPPALNLGSPPKEFSLTPRMVANFTGESFFSGRPFIDHFDDVPGSIHGPALELFSGEAVWSEADRATRPLEFCGGHPAEGGCATRIGDHATRPWRPVLMLEGNDHLTYFNADDRRGGLPMGQPPDDSDEPRVVLTDGFLAHDGN